MPSGTRGVNDTPPTIPAKAESVGGGVWGEDPPPGYATPGGDSLFMTRDEIIKVRGAADVVLPVRQTVHGPVISDIGLAEDVAGDGEVVSLAWTGLLENDLLIGDYYSFVLRFLLAFGLAFLYPVFLFSAAAAGLISSQQMASGRRWAVLIVVTGAALITPTGDVLNLAILAVPLYLMYEITYWLVRLVLKK